MPAEQEATVKIHYSASSNITFRGVIDTEIPLSEWHEMTEKEQDSAVAEELFNLIDVSVED